MRLVAGGEDALVSAFRDVTQGLHSDAADADGPSAFVTLTSQ